MPESTTIAIQQPALRLLTARKITWSLKRFQLPLYSHIAWWLNDLAHRYYIIDLYRGVFDEDPPVDYYATWDLEIQFVGRVNDELFPVHLATMDMYVNCGENPFEASIPIDGNGIAWECEFIVYLPEYAQPMVAVLGAAGKIEPGNLEEWWSDRNYDHVPQIRWPDDALDRLQELPNELRGLATLYHCVMKDGDNEFIDVPGGDWANEYIYEFYFWTVENVLLMAKEFDQVRDQIHQLHIYTGWFEQFPSAMSRVLSVLLDICEESDDNSD